GLLDGVASTCKDPSTTTPWPVYSTVCKGSTKESALIQTCVMFNLYLISQSSSSDTADKQIMIQGVSMAETKDSDQSSLAILLD
ncbi:hypothetical protein L9F63_024417, partial [Diploptera punctata]